MTNIKTAIIGGDLRQLVVAREFAKKGYEVTIYGFDIYEGDYGAIKKADSLEKAINGAKCVILPLPFSYDSIRLNCPLTKEIILIGDVFSFVNADALILGGRITPEIFETAAKKNIKIIDYYEREELSILNAIPTAEGAVMIAMSELPITVHGMKTAVLGYGRVGKVLAKTLCSLGATVHVFARKVDALAWAKVYGCVPVEFEKLADYINEFDCVFNTAPSQVINSHVIEKMRKNTLVIDLASKPGGVDIAAAEKHGIRSITALSLPGKVAPDTAGRFMSETISNILAQEGVT